MYQVRSGGERGGREIVGRLAWLLQMSNARASYDSVKQQTRCDGDAPDERENGDRSADVQQRDERASPGGLVE